MHPVLAALSAAARHRWTLRTHGTVMVDGAPQCMKCHRAAPCPIVVASLDRLERTHHIRGPLACDEQHLR